MTRTALVALLALCAATWAPALEAKGARESMEEAADVPQNFPESKAVPFNADKLPTSAPKTSPEAIDMKNSADLNDTERVNHPQVKDPGTTHAEGTEGSAGGAGRGSIRACTLPNSLREHGANGTSSADGSSSASDWLADSGNVTKVCHLPVRWLHGASASRTLRVCTIPHDAWNSSYTITDGTIPKELLAEVNTSSVKCVTPSEALSNSSGGVTNDSIANGSILSAWLRDSKNIIYIYIIPQEWLRGSQPPAPSNNSEVEDLTKDTLDVESAVGDTNATTTTAAPGTSSAGDAASTTVASAGDAAAAASKATNQTVAPSANSTTPPTPGEGNSTSAAAANTTVVAPIAKATESNGTVTSTSAPAVVPADSTSTTKSLKEETTIPTQKPREETTKPSAQPKEDTTKPTESAVGTTKGTEKPAALPATTATKKPEETVTGGTETKTTERPKETEKPEVHSDTENEVGHRPSSEALSQHSDHNHAASSGKTAFLQPTESAAILAGVFVAIALLGYAGLLLWRRVLEKRYGNREMLVNEDDDFDTSDMRHFEL